MALLPENASDSLIHALTEIATVPELFFSTSARHTYEYDRVPWGHDTGWRCTDGNYDGPDSPVGYGLTQNEAFADLIRNRDPKPVQRTKDIDCGREEPHDYVSVGSASDWENDE